MRCVDTFCFECAAFLGVLVQSLVPVNVCFSFFLFFFFCSPFLFFFFFFVHLSAARQAELSPIGQDPGKESWLVMASPPCKPLSQARNFLPSPHPPPRHAPLLSPPLSIHCLCPLDAHPGDTRALALDVQEAWRRPCSHCMEWCLPRRGPALVPLMLFHGSSSTGRAVVLEQPQTIMRDSLQGTLFCCD